LRESQVEAAITMPTESKPTAKIATAEARNRVVGGDKDMFDARFVDNFEGIDRVRLPQFTKSSVTQENDKSWSNRCGYHLEPIKNLKRFGAICKDCHQYKIINGVGTGSFNIFKAITSSACIFGSAGKATTSRRVIKVVLACLWLASLRQTLAAGV
jgi:hypothetical protein